VAEFSTGDAETHFSKLVVWKGELYFLASTFAPPLFVREWGLWKSNGTAEGTIRVTKLPASDETNPLFHQELTAVGGRLYFKLYTPERGLELWVSDGTAANTRILQDLQPGFRSSSPEGLTVLGDTLFWFASEPGVVSLWKTEGTGDTVRRVKTLPGFHARTYLNDEAYPVATAHRGAVYFFADDGPHGLELWRSDGTEAGTVMVRDALPGILGWQPQQLLSTGETLLFTDWSEYHQLWRSDGTASGTAHVSKAYATGRMTSIHGTVYVSLDTENTPDPNQELWSFIPGAEELRKVAEIRPGPKGSNPAGFTLFKGWVVFSADDGASGRELWSMPLAPVTCPPPRTQEATSPQGAAVSFPAARVAPDANLVSGVTYSHASGTVFPFGTTSVTVTAEDPVYPATHCGFTVTVKDTTAPQLTCPADLTAEAPAGSQGAAVELPRATATDVVSGTLDVSFSPASGSTFPVGTTQVTASATDGAGNKTQCQFKVTVTRAAANPGGGGNPGGGENPGGGSNPDDGGSGCASTGSGLQTLWGLLLVGWAAVRRRSSTRPAA
jgi:ELWxxDGT repeat protein